MCHSRNKRWPTNIVPDGFLAVNEQPRNHFQYQPTGRSQNTGYFTYKITPNVISITDTGLGSRSVSQGIEAVSRKIEHWHQGSISSFKIMSRDGKGFWHEVRWDGKTASFLGLEETDERKACKKLFGYRNRTRKPTALAEG
jgi:hypothetical protein